MAVAWFLFFGLLLEGDEEFCGAVWVDTGNPGLEGDGKLLPLPLCWMFLRSVAFSRKVLSSCSAAIDGEQDGDFRERRKLTARPRGLWELFTGERGWDLGVRSSINSPASSCRDKAVDMSSSLWQRSPKTPSTYNGNREWIIVRHLWLILFYSVCVRHPTFSPPAQECLFFSSSSCIRWRRAASFASLSMFSFKKRKRSYFPDARDSSGPP